MWRRGGAKRGCNAITFTVSCEKWLIDSSLSSCHEKATVALCGLIRIRLGCGHFPRFWLTFGLFRINLLFVRSHLAEIISVRRFIQSWMQQLEQGKEYTQTMQSWSSQNDVSALSITLPTLITFLGQWSCGQEHIKGYDCWNSSVAFMHFWFLCI